MWMAGDSRASCFPPGRRLSGGVHLQNLQYKGSLDDQRKLFKRRVSVNKIAENGNRRQASPYANLKFGIKTQARHPLNSIAIHLLQMYGMLLALQPPLALDFIAVLRDHVPACAKDAIAKSWAAKAIRERYLTPRVVLVVGTSAEQIG